MIIVLMAEGEVVESIIMDDKDAHNLADLIEEWNAYVDDWTEKYAHDEKHNEFLSFTEWLDIHKNITTGPVNVGVISIVDGYWYT